PLSITSGVHFNPQTGLFDQHVRVSNPTRSPFNAVRVNIFVQTNAVHVYNPSGTTNGIPYVQSAGPVAPGSFIDFVIEYYVTSPGVVPNPVLTAEVVPLPAGGGVSAEGTMVPINRVLLRPDGSFLVEFASLTNRVYYVQYSTDTVNWQTAVPAIAGNGTWIQWIDSGPPKTATHPASEPARYYRVILLP